MDNLSPSDVALLNDNGLGGGNAFLWIFALLILAGGGFNGFGGNNHPAYATQAEMTAGFNNQNVQNQLQQIALSSANNNYETAQLINGQTNTLMQQNNTNLINAIQGFNQVNQSIATQGAQIAQAINQLGYQLDQCCCSIKTQMLQDRLSDSQFQLNAAQNAISNANQSQYLLGQLGRFVAWAGNGAPATATGS